MLLRRRNGHEALGEDAGRERADTGADEETNARERHDDLVFELPLQARVHSWTWSGRKYDGR